MSRHVKLESSFASAQRQKVSARQKKVEFLGSLSPDEISALNKGGRNKMKQIASAFQGYVI